MLFHCNGTLFFNSIHVQCCNVDSNLSVCFFFVVCFFSWTLANSNHKFIDNLSSGHIIFLHKL